MNLCLFFEGTGQGVAGRFTNVTRLYEACVASDAQRSHLEAGPGTRFGAYVRGRLHGVDWWRAFRSARRWFETQCPDASSPGEAPDVFLFGFSRGALIARRFAAWLEARDVDVAYLGLWDTVDATAGLDVSVTAPPNVRVARHAVARDERRRFYAYVPLKPDDGKTGRPQDVEELVFPGSHSDVGGLYEDNHVVADAALAWVAEGAVKAGLLLKDRTILSPPADRRAVLHDSGDEATNLWGALGNVARKLKGLRRHPLCRFRLRVGR